MIKIWFVSLTQDIEINDGIKKGKIQIETKAFRNHSEININFGSIFPNTDKPKEIPNMCKFAEKTVFIKISKKNEWNQQNKTN